MILATLAVLTVFTYRHCCIGMDQIAPGTAKRGLVRPLVRHALHHTDRHASNLMLALLWPYGWWQAIRFAAGWLIPWEGVIEPFICMIETWREGLRVDIATHDDIEVSYLEHLYDRPSHSKDEDAPPS